MEQPSSCSLHWRLQQEEVQVQFSNSSSAENWETAYIGTADSCSLALPQQNCLYHVRLLSQSAGHAELRCRVPTFCRAKQQKYRQGHQHQRSMRSWLYSEPLLVCSVPSPLALNGIGTSVVLTWKAPGFACVQRPAVQVSHLLEQVCIAMDGDSSTCSTDDTAAAERTLFCVGSRCWFVPSALRAECDYRWRLHVLYNGRLSPPSPWLCHSTMLPALQLVESRNCEVIVRLPSLQSSLHDYSNSSGNSSRSSSLGTSLTECPSCETTSAASNCTDASSTAVAVACTVQCLTAEGQWHTVGEPLALSNSSQHIRLQGLRPHTRLRLRACVQVNMPALRKAVLGALQQLEVQPQASSSAADILEYGLEAAAAARQVTRPVTSYGGCRPAARSSESYSDSTSCADAAAAAAVVMVTGSAAVGTSAAVTSTPALYVRDDRQLEQWFASLRRQGAAIVDATCTSEGTSYLDESINHESIRSDAETAASASVVVEAGCCSAPIDCVTGAALPHCIAVSKGTRVECYAWWQQKAAAAAKQSLSFLIRSQQCDAISSHVRDGCWGRAALPCTSAATDTVTAGAAAGVAGFDEVAVRLTSTVRLQQQQPLTTTADSTVQRLQLPTPVIEVVDSSCNSSSTDADSRTATQLRVQWLLPTEANSDATAIATAAAATDEANAIQSSSAAGASTLLLDMSVIQAAASTATVRISSAAVTTVWSGSLTDAAGHQAVLIPVLHAGVTYSFRLRALLPQCTIVGPAVSYTTTAAAETVTTELLTTTAAADAPLVLQAAPAYFLSTAAKRSIEAGSNRRGSLCVKLTWRHASSDVSTAGCMYTVQCCRTTAEYAAGVGEHWQHVYTGALPECHDAATLGAAHVRARYRVRRVTDTVCADWSEVFAVDMQLAQQQQQQECDSTVDAAAGVRDTVFQLTALQCDDADADASAAAEHRSPTRPTSAMSSSAALRHSQRLGSNRAAAAHPRAHTPQRRGAAVASATTTAPAKLVVVLTQTLGELWGAEYAQMLCSSTTACNRSSDERGSNNSARFDWSTVTVELVDQQLLQAAVDIKRYSGGQSATAVCAQKPQQQQQQRVARKLSAQRPASAATSASASANAPNSRAAEPQRARQLLQKRVVLLAERVYCRQPLRAQSGGTAACRSARRST
jgi:hypothetical protein